MLTTNVLCMKKRKKRRYCVSDVSDYGQRPNIQKRTPGSVVSMMHITEDTPPDMLAGAMDLTVHLPSGRAVKMSVERSTPMMDLLVQMVTVHQLQLSGHILQALAMAPSAGMSDRILPYKPNTPIGALDTQHIRVVPKNRNLPVPKSTAPGQQPFESTFRLKVHLPRNQLYVVRVSQHVYLEDIMSKVCKEKNLDPAKYEFRHPGNLDEVLDPKLTLSDYQITEIYVISKGTGRLTQAFSSSDIMALRKEEERKQFQAKTGGGVFNLIFKRGKPSGGGTGSVSSENRSISPVQSDDSRSVTPPASQPPQILKKEQPPSEKPKPPQRKRRQAPKPPNSLISEETKKTPAVVEKPPSQISNVSETGSKKSENGLLICHSRNCSDSSGYHEASILSDHCNNTSLPRRPRTMIINDDVGDGKLSGEHSKSTGNLAKMSLQSKSTTSLAIPGRKKKSAPPPPPPPVLKAENTSPVVASQLPVETQKESISTALTSQTPPESQPSTRATSARTSITPKVEEVADETETDQQNPKELEKDQNLSVLSSDSKVEADSGICENISNESTEKDDDLEMEADWQYQIPSPPKGFRDASPNLEAATSVVTNPDLIEKLNKVKEEGEICNKLSLENLEKRKSLVYNRELTTSLKYAQDNSQDQKSTAKTSNFKTATFDHRNLPNFKISTYDGKKEKINIFEDDTVRSSNLKRNSLTGGSMENISVRRSSNEDVLFKKPQYRPRSVYNERNKTEDSTGNNGNVERSGSFSVGNNWTPLIPVKRSKSQVALNKYKVESKFKSDENLSRSNSLFDVSGLQSLEVIRKIQTKLSNTKEPPAPPQVEKKENVVVSVPEKQETVQSPPPQVQNIPPPQVQKIPPPQVQKIPPPKVYYSPPSINLGTWSQRPKTQVQLKEDTDYKFSTSSGNNNSRKIDVNSSSLSNGGVSIKINAADSILPQKSGNVLIKIGGGGYPANRARPHSIALDSNFDISHVPIVRSVELKKPFKDLQTNSTTITQIYPENNGGGNANFKLCSSNESAKATSESNNNKKNSVTYFGNNEAVGNKGAFRSNVFGPPVVKGFKTDANPNSNNNIRNTWNSSYGTLPAKTGSEILNTNQKVPFSQSNLRRTESNKLIGGNVNNNNIFGNVVLRNGNRKSWYGDVNNAPVPPVAPQMPPKQIAVSKIQQTSTSADQREQLLDAIRNFGGKKGLRTTKG